VNCSQWQEWQDVGYVTAFYITICGNTGLRTEIGPVTDPGTLGITISVSGGDMFVFCGFAPIVFSRMEY